MLNKHIKISITILRNLEKLPNVASVFLIVYKVITIATIEVVLSFRIGIS